MRKIALVAVALALFLIPGASIHMASAESVQPTQTSAASSTQKTAEKTATPSASPEVTVQTGDTLSGIAAANGTTYTRIFDANSSITDPDLIYPGDKVRIPASDEQLTDRTVTPSPTVVTVSYGDTLDGIAAANGTTTQRIYDANGSISDPNVIYAGQQVTIPTSDQQLTDRAMPAPAASTSNAAPAVTTAASSSDANSAAVAAAKSYIYTHESSNNPDATNWLGCYGLGQDCNGLLKGQCGDNYDCQDKFFDNYAQQRYGGWINAQAFWEANGWW